MNFTQGSERLVNNLRHYLDLLPSQNQYHHQKLLNEFGLTD